MGLVELKDISYQVELYSDTLEEIKGLYEEHNKELSTLKLDMNYEMYQKLEELGCLLVITCRKHGIIIGYIYFVLSNSLHYKTMRVAVEDLYFLKKEERKGRVGLNLFLFAEMVLKKFEINQVTFGTKTLKDNSSLFEYLGYKQIEKVYTKML